MVVPELPELLHMSDRMIKRERVTEQRGQNCGRAKGSDCVSAWEREIKRLEKSVQAQWCASLPAQRNRATE